MSCNVCPPKVVFRVVDSVPASMLPLSHLPRMSTAFADELQVFTVLKDVACRPSTTPSASSMNYENKKIWLYRLLSWQTSIKSVSLTFSWCFSVFPSLYCSKHIPIGCLLEKVRLLVFCLRCARLHLPAVETIVCNRGIVLFDWPSARNGLYFYATATMSDVFGSWRDAFRVVIVFERRTVISCVPRSMYVMFPVLNSAF